MRYIKLNIVPTGAVSNTGQWQVSSFREIQEPPKRYRIIDLDSLQRLLEIDGLERLQQTLTRWVEDALHRGELKRNPVWSESVAVGNPEFLEAKSSQTVTGDLAEPARRAAEALETHVSGNPWIVYGGDSAQRRGECTLLRWHQAPQITAK